MDKQDFLWIYIHIEFDALTDISWESISVAFQFCEMSILIFSRNRWGKSVKICEVPFCSYFFQFWFDHPATCTQPRIQYKINLTNIKYLKIKQISQINYLKIKQISQIKYLKIKQISQIIYLNIATGETSQAITS